MDKIGQVVLNAAVRTGSNIVKEIIEKQLGPTIGGAAGSLIDMVATNLGVEPEEIPSVPQTDIDHAVIAADESPEILRLYVEQQRMTNSLLLAEMQEKEGAWTWAWRPAWMWFLMLLWAWNGIINPLVQGAFGASIPPIPYEYLAGVTAVYTTLYLGGHTVKSAMRDYVKK